MKISETVHINASIGRVFDVFTDLGQAQANLSGINSLELLDGPEKMQVGTRWRETRTMMGMESTEEMWVSELTSNKSYAVDAESHGTKYHSEFTFEEVDGGIDVTWMFGGEPQTVFAKIMSLSTALFSGSMKKMLGKDLGDLKIACEKGE
jgi:hypothetical protein